MLDLINIYRYIEPHIKMPTRYFGIALWNHVALVIK